MTHDRLPALVALAALAVAAPASAQGGSSVPSGLFGANRAGGSSRDLLTLQMALSESIDSDVAPEFRERLPGGQLPGRRSSLLAAGVDYARNRRAVQFSAGATSLLRYSYDLEAMKPGAASARVGVGLRMPGRAGTLSLSQALTYSPSYLYQLLPDDAIDSEPGADPPPPDNPDYRIDTRDSLAYRTRLRLQTGSGLGWRMTSTAEHGQTDFGDNAARGERRIWDGSARVSYHPTRRGSVSFGYRYRASSYGGDNTSQVHEVPVGFDVTPALTPLRRVTFRVVVTPTMMNTFGLVSPAPDAGADVPAVFVTDGILVDASRFTEGREDTQRPDEGTRPVDGRHRYAVQGEAGLSYPISLRWLISTAYQRRIQTLAVLAEPVATHGAQVRLAGVMGRRVDVAVQARYTRGASAAGVRGNRLATAQGSARLRFALTRSIALSGEYLYYRYDFGGNLLAPDLPPFLERHGVRVGISMFAQPIGR